MHMNSRSLVVIVITMLFCSSCIQKRFIHNASPTINPMIREKNEGFASGYFHTNGESTVESSTDPLAKTSSGGLNLQGGYAVAKNLAVVGNYNYLKQKSFYSEAYSDPFDTSNVKYNRNEFTIAGDFFVTHRSKKSGLNLLFGITTGKLKIDDYGRSANANYSRQFTANELGFFIQPCFNIYFDENSGIGFHAKVGSFSYNQVQTNYTTNELQVLRLNNTSSIFTSEVGFKFAIGVQAIPLSIDGQFNYIFNNSNLIYIRRPNFSVGATYRFHPKKK